MDTEAKPIGNDMWIVTDLLGRKLATIVRSGPRFVIEYDEPGRLEGIVRGPHDTLDMAFTAIEKRTAGQCRRVAL